MGTPAQTTLTLAASAGAPAGPAGPGPPGRYRSRSWPGPPPWPCRTRWSR